jgi:D-amino peptidase
MKLFVSCDMEGTAGVSSWQQVDARSYTPEYAVFQKYMTGEVRAAIEGARSAGATEMLINDSHGPMRNLLLDELPHDVRVLFGNRKPLSMAQNLSREFAGVFFTGYHGAVGDLNATLSHTYAPSVIYEVRINGISCSEALLNAGVAGYFGVPVLLITYDRRRCPIAHALAHRRRRQGKHRQLRRRVYVPSRGTRGDPRGRGASDGGRCGCQTVCVRIAGDDED